MMIFVGILPAVPIMLLIVAVYTSLYIGWTALIGIFIFTLSIPLQVNSFNFQNSFDGEDICNPIQTWNGSNALPINDGFE